MKRALAFALAMALSPAVVLAQFDAATATNQIGLDLYRQLAPGKPGENLVLSPYSIESALALAYAGADGDTRTEMARVLRYPDDNAALQSGFAQLRTALNEMAEASKRAAEVKSRVGDKTDPIAWHAANRLFGQQGYAFRAPFLTLMQDGFDAPFAALDFGRDAEKARRAINDWVEEQTREKIKDLIPPRALSEDTRLVLVNALYLKAPWQKPFAKHATQERAFRSAPDHSRQVPTMHDTSLRGYVDEDGFIVVTLPYLGSDLQFVILLPDENQSVDAIAARITAENFTRYRNLGQKDTQRVSLYLPKFKVEGATIPLGETLRAMGLKHAFDEPLGSANFDRIAPRKPDDYLLISEVFHQTFIEVDEEGTEAAAATAASMVLGASMQPQRPIEVRVDRPFLFAIQHRASGACLFLGRIADPR